jgi:hypothetical protein
MRKAAIGSRNLYNVISEEEYLRRTQMNPEAMKEISSDMAIEKDGYIYPILNTGIKGSSVVGVKDYGPVLQYSHPTTEEDKETFSNSHIIDMQNKPDGIKGMIQRTAELDAAERTMLIDKDNISHFVVQEQDTPEFALLKQALNQKNIDMSSYRHRHGSDYSNNMRILTSGNSITFGKLRAIAEASDIEVEITMRDKPGCANPIGSVLSTTII